MLVKLSRRRGISQALSLVPGSLTLPRSPMRRSYQPHLASGTSSDIVAFRSSDLDNQFLSCYQICQRAVWITSRDQQQPRFGVTVDMPMEHKPCLR